MKEAKPNTELKNLLRSLPEKPGIYQYFDKEGKIIYVGKAKNLKKRVGSYFTKTHQSGKLRLLVRKIADIKFVVTATEMDALLLENNLIKEYQPRYNIQLKDDKSFPWICIKNEPFPRIFSTRHPIKDGSEYFGPYASVRMMRTLLDIIKQLFPLRTCKLNLHQKNIEKEKYKVCLEYHIGNCKAPCVGKQSETDYNESIQQARSIIKGNIAHVIAELKKLMHLAAGEMDFERAQMLKEKVEILEKYKSKSTIVNPRINNIDVLSIVTEDDLAYVNYLHVVKGAIVQAHTVEIKKKLDETTAELLAFAFTDFRNRFNSTAREIILPFNPQLDFPDIKLTIPQRGDKKQLLELSERNARYYQMERRKQASLIDPDRHKKRTLNRMQKDLRMKVLPEIIECFDNSNIQGSYPVAAMVQFVNIKPNKKAYRHFNIKTVVGPDDFASMEEVILRRYGRLQKEKEKLPQLIVVDGGKGQLSSAVKSLKALGLYGKITVIGIAKKLEELYFPGDPLPLYLDKTSETLKIIQQLRDEAHRFGITHHRKRREKGTIKSQLTAVDGIGYSTAQKLLRKFKSVKRVKAVSFEQLTTVIGRAKAKVVFDHFHPQQENRKESTRRRRQT
ncbi:MAG: excinuclease ABC subunit UvrC [Bacteroidales bacterium]|nr:excinuclease ABC subunit UvrC [Bacteroidales bacterium]